MQRVAAKSAHLILHLVPRDTFLAYLLLKAHASVAHAPAEAEGQLALTPNYASQVVAPLLVRRLGHLLSK